MPAGPSDVLDLWSRRGRRSFCLLLEFFEQRRCRRIRSDPQDASDQVNRPARLVIFEIRIAKFDHGSEDIIAPAVTGTRLLEISARCPEVVSRHFHQGKIFKHWTIPAPNRELAG